MNFYKALQYISLSFIKEENSPQQFPYLTVIFDFMAILSLKHLQDHSPFQSPKFETES